MAALRAATVGVSLCDAETSVAAPGINILLPTIIFCHSLIIYAFFIRLQKTLNTAVTSKLQTPGAVVDVIKEGRCSLITAYVLVNYNIMYGIVQLFMSCFLYSYAIRVGDYMYLLQDLFFTLVLGLCISNNPPSDELCVECPPQRFFTPHLICKLFFQLICFPCFQFIALSALRSEDW